MRRLRNTVFRRLSFGVALLLLVAAARSAEARIESYAVEVRGGVSDSAVTVTANGHPGVVTGGAFRVPGVELTPGPNTITVAVADGAWPAVQQSVTVFLQNVRPGEGGRRFITARGTIAGATGVTVQVTHPDGSSDSRAGVIAGDAYTMTDIPIAEGANRLVCTASNGADYATQERWVFLDTVPPDAPTVNAVPPYVTDRTVHLAGAKPAGAAVWVNSQQVVPLDHMASWSADVTLPDGRQTLAVTTRDAAGNAGAPLERTLTILRQPLPPTP